MSTLRKRVKGFLKGDVRVTRWPQYKLLYVRLPKNGNTSIRAAIDGGEDMRLPARRVMQPEPGWQTFTFVRNPWARLVSIYNHKVGERATSRRMEDGVYMGFLESGIPVYAGMGFPEFCEMVCEIPDGYTDKHLRSQYGTLVRGGELIASFVGRFENMVNDWDTLMSMSGLDCSLPHIHRTYRDSEHYSDYYTDDRLVELVARRYADDVRQFGYAFDRRALIDCNTELV